MKTTHFILGTFLALLLYNYSLGGQNAVYTAGSGSNLTGTVLDSVSGSPIEYATVVILCPADSSLVCGVVTNEKGEFLLADVPKGEYNMRVQFMGFNTLEVPDFKVDESKGSVDIGSIKLYPSVMSLDDVTVSAERRMVEYQLDKKVINASANIASAGGTAVEILRNNPSVTVDIEDNVNLRGRTDYQVLINGRPTALSGPEAIKHIAAASVDRIEIITNPSAAYEAAGTAGIINIILKQNARNGFGAVVNLTGGNDRFNTDVNLNYTKNKWNFVLGLSMMDFKVPVHIDRDRKFFDEDSLSLLNESAIQYHITKSKSISLGADYDMNKRNLFSASFNAGTWVHIHDFESKYNLHDKNRDDNFYTISENYFQIGYEFLTGNFNYKHIFPQENHELTANLYYSYINGYRDLDASQYITNKDWETNVTIPLAMSDETSNAANIRLNIDYKLPINGNTVFDAGTQLEHNPSVSDMNYENYDAINEKWVINEKFSNNIDFHTSIIGTYATLSQTYDKFEYRLGMRGEYYESLFDLNKTGEKYNFESFDFFPSVHISYKPSDKNQAQLSYSRRVNRPNAWLMYPAPDLDDIYMSSEGNPSLVPFFTDSYELVYIRNIPKGLISSEIYHRQAKNTFTRIILPDDDGRLYHKFYNYGNSISTGVEVAVNRSFGDKLSTNLSATFYHYSLIVDLVEYEDVESYSGNIRLNTSAKINETTRLQLNLAYNAPYETVQGKFTQNLGSSIAVRKDFPSINSSLTLTAQNPILGREFITEINGQNFNYKSNDMIKPMYYLTFSYRLNNFRRHRSNVDNTAVGEGVG